MAANPFSAPGSASFQPAVSAQAAGQPAPTRGLAELEERLASAVHGVVVVRASRDVTHAVIAHVARRVRANGQPVVVARPLAGAPLWRAVASRVSLAKIDCEPTKCAEQIGTAAMLRRAVIVAPLPRAGTWDRAVAAELAAASSGPLIVFVADMAEAANDLRSERFDVSSTLDADAKKLWLAAVAEEAHGLVDRDDLGTLEAWWASVKRVNLTQSTSGQLSVPEEGQALFTALAPAGRAWSTAEIGAIGGHSKSLGALVQAGAVQVDRGGVVSFASIAPTWDAIARLASANATADERAQVATALEPYETEPWAWARIAELRLRAGDTDGADQAHTRALAMTDDATARREIVARWMTEVDTLPAASQLELRVRAAERALAAGEADEAHRWAQTAATIATDDARVTLLLGRASAALGDLVAAKVALHRAREHANDIQTDALIGAELAEVAYLTGDLATAEREATSSMTAATDIATRLRARNTLGKLLLAASKWDAADEHFAADAMLASQHREITAELRALLNRGIALLSKGLVDEARSIFETVLNQGELIGEPRACAYALGNLAVVAMRRHEYATALSLWERTIRLRHSLRDRVATARTLANLADLRVELGLFDHAEHALSFGRRVLGPGMPVARSAQLSVVAARIALARGNTVEARREIDTALVDVEVGGDLEFLADAFRVAARIALDDGDLARASASLGRARELGKKEGARAELALLTAMLERGSGNDDISPATEALALTRAYGKENWVRESHVLNAELQRNAGNLEAARSHVEQALAIRDRVADALPADVRNAFLARPDIVGLTRLQALLAQRIEPSMDDAPPTVRLGSARPTPAVPREMVGDDPAIRGLIAAIRKVARSSSTVLVRGESGTGKELVAEALHRASERASGPLVTVNCAALVETLLLSELFGHEKGAFTGAFARRRGRFELAEGGTLFLDEIGDISPRTQVALLRVLQERTFERVGGTTPIRANVRIICATHRDLRAMVERGEFREDLYYRLRGITLEVPALRARMGDLARISNHLLVRIAAERSEPMKSLSADAIELLSRHRWPGNVRELENALRAASLFAESELITASDLIDNVDDLRAVSQVVAQAAPSLRPSTMLPASLPSFGDLPSDVSLTSMDDVDPSADGDSPLPAVEANATAVAYAQVRQGAVSLSDIKRQIERDCIARALAETKGNITRAAALLGMKRPRLSQLVKQYGLAAVSSEAS